MLNTDEKTPCPRCTAQCVVQDEVWGHNAEPAETAQKSCQQTSVPRQNIKLKIKNNKRQQIMVSNNLLASPFLLFLVSFTTCHFFSAGGGFLYFGGFEWIVQMLPQKRKKNKQVFHDNAYTKYIYDRLRIFAYFYFVDSSSLSNNACLANPALLSLSKYCASGCSSSLG